MSAESDKAFAAARANIAWVRKNKPPKLDLSPRGTLGRLAGELDRLPDEISSLTGISVVDVSDTKVSDISPLANLKGVRSLFLAGTRVEDLVPISRLTQIAELDLGGSLVYDLKPIRQLRRLEVSPFPRGLVFRNTPATASNPRLAEIAEIPGKMDRARSLFRYLDSGDLPFWSEDGNAPLWTTGDDPFWKEVESNTLGSGSSLSLLFPPRHPAPLETEVRDGRLVRRVPDAPLPEGEMDDRARKGWPVIRADRNDFAGAVNLDNYRALKAAIGALDRGMGSRFEDLNQIAVGNAGERLARLAGDAGLLANLPDGSGAELVSLAASVQTFANRFPEWIAYREDAETDVAWARRASESVADLEKLQGVLLAAEEVEPKVADEYRDEVQLLRENPQSEAAARAVLRSTRELLRTLAENAIMGARLYLDEIKGTAAKESKAGRRILPDELRKWTYRGLAFGTVKVAWDVFLGQGTILAHLAATHPTLFSWLSGVLRFLGVNV